MSTITTYPLDGIEYDATDAAGYFATRQSGVYKIPDDFPVTADGTTTLTVGAGQAWVHPSRFTGYSIIMAQDTQVTLPSADSALPRIDRIVLRYDATARESRVQVLVGTPGGSPVAPDITRTELIYDLCLAEITRPAGSTTITSTNVKDTRKDASLCGLMQDAPDLDDYVLPIASKSGLGCVKIGSNLNVSSDGTVSLNKGNVVSALGFTPAAEGSTGGSGTTTDLTIGTVTSGTTASASISGGKLNLVLPKGDKGDTGDSGTDYVLPAASASTLGGVKVGNNLSISSDGTLTVNIGAGTTDLTAGSSALASGVIYLVYE